MKELLLLGALLCALPPSAQGAPPTPWVKADVVTVDAARGRVLLRHEPIKTKSIDMGAMTMPFKVADRASLKPLKAGDKVRFVVTLHDDEPLITQIEALR